MGSTVGLFLLEGGAGRGVLRFPPDLAPLVPVLPPSILLAFFLFPGFLWLMAKEPMYSQVREDRNRPFALKRPWLGEIRSYNSPAACKLLQLVGFV